MKAITLYQPWATLVAIGAKTVETRSWYVGYRGPIAIHAAKDFPLWAADLLAIEPFYSVLRAENYGSVNSLPYGAIVATAEIIGCVQIEAGQSLKHLGQHELAFGDYRPGRYMWHLDNVKKLENPIPAKGAQRLWEWKTSSSKTVISDDAGDNSNG